MADAVTSNDLQAALKCLTASGLTRMLSKKTFDLTSIEAFAFAASLAGYIGG